MKAFLILALVCLAAAQFQKNTRFRVFGNQRGRFQNQRNRIQRQRNRFQNQGIRFQNQQRQRQNGIANNQVSSADHELGSSEYHFSWRHAGRNTKWAWGGAVGYCRGLGGGWGPISINDNSENSFVAGTLTRDNIPYVWTGGQKSGNGWRWPVGRFSPLAWSHTGGRNSPQPDNREGNENCLAVLNNFYNDGVKWHDIGCSHKKPIICERSV